MAQQTTDRTEQRGRHHEPKRPTFDVSRLFEKAAPASVESEMALLGSMILDPHVTPEVLTFVQKGESFYLERHATIFDALLEVYDRRQSGDLVQVYEVLEGKGVVEDIGGSDYLVELGRSVPSAVNAPHYAKVVSEKHRLRRLIDAAGQILYDAHHAGEIGPDGAREVLDKAEAMIFDVAESASTLSVESLKELLMQTMDSLLENDGREVTGLDTGYHELNQMTSGLQQGEMVVIAARPSMGKTALALNLAEQIALAGDHGAAAPVAFFSLEMSRQAVVQRLLCAHSGVDSHRFRRNMLNMDERRTLQASCGELMDAPLLIDDTPGLTILQLRARARRLARQHHVRCIIIDYLQLLTAPGSSRESRQVEVSAISRGVKALARELNVPVVCLSQLNRGAEMREGHRPRMSDLRESGSIEQDADVIALLHREEYYYQANPDWALDNPEKVGLAELIIAKQRNGPTGVVDLSWDAKTTRFRNHAGRAYAATTPAPAQSAPFDSGGAFGGREKTGPIDDHRDGGGPSQDWDNADAGDLPI